MTQKEIKESLINQLKLQGKTDQFYLDLVDDYMDYVKIRKQLKADIKKRGLRDTTINGNGVSTEKPNESVVNLQKTSVTMLKILSDLNLKNPIPPKADPKDGYC